MNPTPDRPDRDQRLRQALDASAAGFDLDLAAPDEIEARARRRRRHRRLVAGGAVVALMVGSAVVIATGSDDSMVSTDDSVPTPATTTPTADSTPSDGTTAGTDATPPPDTAAVETLESSAPADLTQTAVPFAEGFAVLTSRMEPTMLPGQLPPEVSELFSDEVTELFADGLPATMDEATEMLSEAGLLDEVSQVFSNNPEAWEALRGPDTPSITTEVWTTADGATWTRAEVPANLAGAQITSSGGGLAVWGTQYDGDGRPTGATIAATDDLATWRFADLELARDLPPYLLASLWIPAVAVVDGRWYALVTEHYDIDWASLLPAADAEALNLGAYSMSYDHDGITITHSTEDGETTRSYSNADLGLADGELADHLDHGPSSRLLSGVFGEAGPPEEIDLPGDSNGAYVESLVTVDGELIYVYGTAYRWGEEGSWTPLDGLPSEVTLTGATRLGDDLLLIGLLIGQRSQSAPLLYRWAVDGALVEIAGPDLAFDYTLWGQPPSSAWIVTPMVTIWPEEPRAFTVDHDGLHYEVVDDYETFTVRVSEAATGEVLVDRIIPADERSELYSAVSSGDLDVVSITDDDGNEIGQVPADLMVDAYLQAGSDAVVASDGDGTMALPDSSREVWLVATADGNEWLTRSLAVGSPDESDWSPIAAAVNGDRLLVHDTTGWSIETLP